MPPDREPLRLFPTLARLFPALPPELRLLPTVVEELLPSPLRPVDAPPTRVVPRQLSLS